MRCHESAIFNDQPCDVCLTRPHVSLPRPASRIPIRGSTNFWPTLCTRIHPPVRWLVPFCQGAPCTTPDFSPKGKTSLYIFTLDHRAGRIFTQATITSQQSKQLDMRITKCLRANDLEYILQPFYPLQEWSQRVQDLHKSTRVLVLQVRQGSPLAVGYMNAFLKNVSTAT